MLFAFASSAVWASSGAAARTHDMAGFSAGEPGDANKPSWPIEATMQESDGKMLFVSSSIAIRKGEQIKFALSNDGERDHEFVLATTQENLEHAEMTMKNSEMRHADPNASGTHWFTSL